MTNSPEATGREPRRSVGDPHEAGTLDAGTLDGVILPRGRSRIPLDGAWHQVARQYALVRCLSLGMLAAVVVVVGGALWWLAHLQWVWMPGAAVLAVIVVMIAVTPRQARSIGYRLRDDDLVFRRGILWQRMVAVPYGRMQLVDISHGPLDRGFGLAQVKLVTAAATTGVVIPGLRQRAAEELRDTLVAVAESRRTGL